MPDGTGIRNYLYSRLISEFNADTEILLWHNISETAVANVRNVHPQASISEEPIAVYVENLAERVLREASTYARLKWYCKKMQNETIMFSWRKKKNLKQKVLYRLAEFLGNLAQTSYGNIRKTEALYTRLISRPSILKPYIDILQKHRPDVLFCTHQRVPWLVPVIEAAKQLQIKTVTAIYSWDNIPKGRLHLRTDKYLVWSEYMKSELLKFYPEVEPENIEVAGSPQFEFYTENQRLQSREAFAQRFQLDTRKKWICFSGDDVDTSPYDPLYLNDIAEAVQQISEDQRPHILFRRTPADTSNRYRTVLEKHRNIITNIEPVWCSDNQHKGWSGYYPLPEDVDLLVNLAWHCELAINIGSTIAHDFAVYNKPTLYLNYEQFHRNAWSIKMVYRFEHFKSMHGLSAVEWIKSKEEIKDLLLHLLSNPGTGASDKGKWLNRILIEDFDKSSHYIAQALSAN